MPEATSRFRASLDGMDASPLEAWRDTLRELGVVGLVREPRPLAEQAPIPPRQSAPPRPEPISPSRPSARIATYSAPTDAIGCPPPEAIAGAANLQALEQAIQGCLKCPLGPGRIRFVFGEGSPSAKLMFVGEGPGRDEDMQGRPFVGKAGELLDRMIGAIGMTREETYIANVVKCRPPDNRTPTSDEAQACRGYLLRQIQLIRPVVLVTLGATPLRELLGLGEGITRVRGQWRQLELDGRRIPVMPTFHPAYVLRQYTQDVRRAVWEDLKAAKEWIDKAEGA